MSQAGALRVVRLTARSSAALFAGAQVASLAGRRGARASEALYQGFMVAHVVHFAAVTRYAVLTGGHDLFPGGRDPRDVGGWTTVAGIFTGFAGVATLGWVGLPTTTQAKPWTAPPARLPGPSSAPCSPGPSPASSRARPGTQFPP